MWGRWGEGIAIQSLPKEIGISGLGPALCFGGQPSRIRRKHDAGEERKSTAGDLTVLGLAAFLIATICHLPYRPQDDCHLLVASPLLFHSESPLVVTLPRCLFGSSIC